MKSVYKRLFFITLALLCLSGCCLVSTGSAEFDLDSFIIDVFDPQPGETVLFMVDRPPSETADNEEWFNRRQMAEEWHRAFQNLGEQRGFNVLPILSYLATGAHSGPLPERGSLSKKVVSINEILQDVNIVIAMTEFSATGALLDYIDQSDSLRIATMPRVSRRMQETALAADYSEVARKAHILTEKLNQSVSAEVQFSTGHELFIDLQNRTARADDGNLHAGNDNVRLINLPSGEAYIAPYEGEIRGKPSGTHGEFPVIFDNDIAVLKVEDNRVVEVVGEGETSFYFRKWLDVDSARRNLAELGLGCNDQAVVTGNVLEDEKVMGMHLALGRSDHIGGFVGVDEFTDPENAVHWDLVYPVGGEIEVASLVLLKEDGSTEEIIKNGRYTIFDEAHTLGVGDIYTIWLFLAAGSLCYVAWDMERAGGVPGRSKPTWALIVLIFGPIGLGAYLLTFSSRVRSGEPKRANWRTALAGTFLRVSLMCAWLVLTLIMLINFFEESGPIHVLGLGFVIPLLLSIFAFAAPVKVHVQGMGCWRALRSSILAEFIAITLTFIGLFTTVFILDEAWLSGITRMMDPIFWVIIILGGLAGMLLLYPYEYWSAARGFFSWTGWLAAGNGKQKGVAQIPQMRATEISGA